MMPTAGGPLDGSCVSRWRASSGHGSGSGGFRGQALDRVPVDDGAVGGGHGGGPEHEGGVGRRLGIGLHVDLAVAQHHAGAQLAVRRWRRASGRGAW